MSKKLDQIKNKIRASGSSSVHAQLIDTDIIEEDKRANANVNENVDNQNTVVNITEPVLDKLTNEEIPRRKKKFEDLFKRDTFWIRNELKERLDQICAGEKGEKTRIINEALESYFNKRK